MVGKRTLGIIGFDSASRLMACRALDVGYSLILQGSSAEGDLGYVGHEREPSSSISCIDDIGAFAAALPCPRLVLVGLASDKLRGGFFLEKALGHFAAGDTLIAASCESWPEFSTLSASCSARGLGLVDIGLSEGGGSAPALVTGGGKVDDWEKARCCLGDESSAALMGGPGAGSAVALIRSSLDGLQIELISEAYHVLRSGVRASNDEMRTIFAKWNLGDLANPFVAATADALGLMDEDGEPLIEKVLDATVASGPCSKVAAIALAKGVPAIMTSQAAGTYSIEALKDERVDASAVLDGPKVALTGERHAMVEELRKAFLAASILAVAESFSLLGLVSERRSLGLDLAFVARLWADSGKSRILELTAEALVRSGGRWAILLDASLKTTLDQTLPSLRHVASRAIEGGIPVPVFCAALCFYDGYRSMWLPANLSIALRDSTQGLGYERIDRPRGERFHSEWK